jgi:UDP-N-acetylglucosamine 3-dehydrogenase
MADQLRVGIVGMGSFGLRHAGICADLTEVELVAACSRRDASLAPVRDRYGIRTTTDLNEFVGLPDMDAVIVCTPDAAHKEPAVAAALAGKHVFVEKPMATSVADCDEMIRAAKEAGVRLTVGHICRFDPRYWQAHESIVSGKLGDLVCMAARRDNPLSAVQRALGKTSPVFWLGSHDIDMLLWCAQSPVVSVSAREVRRVLGDRGPDAVIALLAFADGTVASLENCWVLPDGSPTSLVAEFRAVGTGGALRIDASTDGLSVADGDSLREIRSTYGAAVAGQSVGALATELRHFARCILDGDPFVVSPAEGREVVRVACAVLGSARLGGPVDLPS